MSTLVLEYEIVDGNFCYDVSNSKRCPYMNFKQLPAREDDKYTCNVFKSRLYKDLRFNVLKCEQCINGTRKE